MGHCNLRNRRCTSVSGENWSWVRFWQRLPRRAALALYSIPRYALEKYYGCGPFHITPAKYKQYCLDIVAYLNSRPNRGSIIDIGCGFGDVLLKAKFKHRVGLDHKQCVLDALRFCARITGRSRTLETRLYKFGEGLPIDGHFDYIVICNWIHNIAPDVLRDAFEAMFHDNLNPDGELIFDTVSGEHYPYQHDEKFLSENINADVFVIGEYTNGHIIGGGSRRVVSLRKYNPASGIRSSPTK